MTEQTALGRLGSRLEAPDDLAVAVSGGVDSLTLALALHRLGHRPHCFHAVSPAVPPSATERVRSIAAREEWTLDVISAGEFDDPDYVANPVDRCFVCKSSLYAAIRSYTDRTIASGTNTDDLDDYRPGLRAAEHFAVRHPFVEAGFSKQDVRALAHSLGHEELARLPASPCLSSRVETGIQIEPASLRAVDRVERWIAGTYGARTVRCRVRGRELTVELDVGTLDALGPEDHRAIERFVRSAMPNRMRETPVRLAPYRRGSAFLVEAGR